MGFRLSFRLKAEATGLTKESFGLKVEAKGFKEESFRLKAEAAGIIKPCGSAFRRKGQRQIASASAQDLRE